MDDALRGFDESTYLELNADVSQAVQSQSFASGLEHYIAYGFSENRPGVSLEAYKVIKKLIENESPLPPEHLRKRVHGDENAYSFSLLGKIVAFNINAAINSIIKLEEHHRILDFGCGCGRIMGNFHKLVGQSKFYGTDIDAEAISWCQQNLSLIGDFVKNEASPPLPFEDDFFDFAYSISVFTHLPEDMQFAWLEELRRVTKPGSYLLLTTHSGKFFDITSIKGRRLFRKNGFHYSVRAATEGLPDFYQTTFHTEDYIYRHWSKFFEIKKIIKKGIANHQDLIICRRPSFENCSQSLLTPAGTPLR